MIDFSNATEELNSYSGSEKKKTNNCMNFKKNSKGEDRSFYV